MVTTISPGVKLYLKQLYSMVRYQLGFDATGMDSSADVDVADVEIIAKSKTLLKGHTRRIRTNCPTN
jgi:hypothetical protein